METILIILHFLFDWILQPRDVAKTKKKKFVSLLKHIIYNVIPYISIIVLIFCYYFGYNDNLAYFWSINVASHILIDMFLPSGRVERSMINWTAVDQILHLSILFLTYKYLILT